MRRRASEAGGSGTSGREAAAGAGSGRGRTGRGAVAGGRGRRRPYAASAAALVAAAAAVLALAPEPVSGRPPWGGGAAADVALDAHEGHVEGGYAYPTLDEPFLGTAAAGWDDGARGIRPPGARATGGMTAEEVAEALRLTRDFLIASNPAAAVVRGGHPQRALVKTRGDMAFEKGEGDGEVVVRADHTFVHPLVQTHPGAEDVTHTVVRRRLAVSLMDPDLWEVTPGTLRVIESRPEIVNAGCDTADGFIHPVFPSDLLGRTPSPAVTGFDPYDRDREIPDAPDAPC
ncbi:MULTISPECIES: hypothetical protein [Streptomyces]|uniref:hypothetical protein n=1 Tax=Streptomyces TaxID=1883 RepID=UPI001120EC08|nr:MULTISPECIES: hypothetical protein [Streptomyces]